MRSFKAKDLIFIIVLALTPFRTGHCQGNTQWPEDLLKILAEEVTGEEAFKHVVALAGWPRIRPEEEYTGTFFEAKYILDKAREYGLEKAQVEYFPWEYQNWAPVAAELWLVEPQSQKITSLDLVPLCLVEDSQSADVQAELVDVGEGVAPGDYQGKDVKGKLVLSSGSESQVNHEAVHLRGALGIISCRALYPDDHPDNVSWGAFSRIILKSPDTYGFGFMISPRQGQQLRRLTRQGNKVVLKAHVETKLYPGKLDVVSAVIPGKERAGEEILFLAHLFEYYYMQGANDNSSGSAAILEAARAMAKLIKDGKIPPPRRSIRFFWEPEGFGTYAYLAKYPEVKSKFKAVIDMDMVGEGHRQCGAVFEVVDTPDSLPHFFNDVIGTMAEYIKTKSGYGQRITTQSFSELMASPAGSKDPFYYDVIHFNPRPYNESWLSIPHILFHCTPDPFYHSLEDRPDKCDPTQLKRAALLGAAAAYYMANLSPQDIPVLCSSVMAAGEKRLAGDRKRALELLARSDKTRIHQDRKEALNILRHGLNREESILLSIGEFVGLPAAEKERLKGLVGKNPASHDPAVENYYSYLCRSFGVRTAEPSLTAEEIRLGRLIPKRLLGWEYSTDFRYLERVLGDPDIQQKISINKAGPSVGWEALNFVDGKRSIFDIRNALSAEFSPVDVSLEMVDQYFTILEKAGVLSINKSGS